MQGAGGVGGLLSVTSGAGSFYPTYDGNGNVSEYLDASGAIFAHFEYDPFGNTVVDTDTTGRFNHRFSTKQKDAVTGLYYYGYRWYDPLTGRWPSRDPIQERGGVNLYGFVGNASIARVDFLGLEILSKEVKVMNKEMLGADKVEYHAELNVSYHCDEEGNVVINDSNSRTLAHRGDKEDHRNPNISSIYCGGGLSGIIVSWEGSAAEEDAQAAEIGAGVGGGAGLIIGGAVGGTAGTVVPGAGTVVGVIGGAGAGGGLGTAVGGG